MSRSRKPVRARSSGSASHNRAAKPGELQVTIWGETEPDKLGRKRDVAMTLDEQAVKALLALLVRYGFDIKGGPQ